MARTRDPKPGEVACPFCKEPVAAGSLKPWPLLTFRGERTTIDLCTRKACAKRRDETIVELPPPAGDAW